MSKTIFLICGESGCGKTSVVKKVCKDLGLKNLVSYTTRPCRGEYDVDHIFIQPEDVAKYEDDIIAKTEINGNVYFCTSEQLKESDFYIIDYNGIQYLKAQQVPDVRYVVVYISVDKSSREKRVKNRGDDMVTYYHRVMDEFYQFERMKRRADYDYSIRNTDFKKTVEVLKSIYEIESKR